MVNGRLFLRSADERGEGGPFCAEQRYDKEMNEAHLCGGMFVGRNVERASRGRRRRGGGREWRNQGAEDLRISPRSLCPFRKSYLGKTRS